MNIQNAILDTQKRTGMFAPGATVVVGVSGGADSLALLHALATLRRTLGINIVAVTVNHGLRGDEAKADVAHVGRLARAWNVPFVAMDVNVRAVASTWKMGIEEAGRRARYDALAATARDHAADRVAVAHHADDQAETVLMHLMRGSGADGLAGMKPVSEMPGHHDLELVRPLLGVTRADILGYCETHAIEYRDDSTNLETESNRNWVRHALLPLIHTRYPGASRALADLARNAALDTELLGILTGAILQAATVSDDQVTLSRDSFRRAPEALQRRAVRWAVARLAPEAELSFERTEAVVDLFLNGRKGQKVELSGGLIATVDHRTVVVSRVTS